PLAVGTTTWVRLVGAVPGPGGGPGVFGVTPGPPTEGVSVKMFLRGRPITMYVPSGLGPVRAELPPERLQLDWVYPHPKKYPGGAPKISHGPEIPSTPSTAPSAPSAPSLALTLPSYGYRGRDSRSNLHVLGSGELVYFIACVVVLLQLPARRQRHYLRHSDCVRWIFGKYKKPKFIQCFIFDAAGAVLTGDSEGNILTWTPSPGKGGKEMYQIGQQTRAHEGSVFALCRRRDGTVLSGGGKDRRVLSWSPALELLHEVELPESFGAVRTIAEGPGEELLVGTTRNALLRGTLGSGFTPIVQGHTDEVWGLATHPNCCRFLTCGHDRQLCLWDGREHALAWSLGLEVGGPPNWGGGHPKRGRELGLGGWLVLDTGTRQLLAGGSDSSEQLSVVRFSPDGTFLAIGSHDNFIYIYSVAEGGRKFSRFGRCTGHSSFITHLDWSKDGRFIMSNSGDYEILYWDVAGGCKLLRNRFESRDREWASYTCVLGFHVFGGSGGSWRGGLGDLGGFGVPLTPPQSSGVWPDGSDGTDINSLCRSHHERVVAVADDFCKVHLFQYPCARPKAPSHVYGGHGSHVTNVRFTHDDGHLVSLGGKDTSVFQWRVLPGDSS
ncbi:hypothetical protein IHE44_0010921, partial [Lamprotornis superbus]